MRMIVTPVVRIAGEQRALDRRGAAPARQQRGMDVDAAEPRHREHRRRQDQAVGHDHERIQPRPRSASQASAVLKLAG